MSEENPRSLVKAALAIMVSWVVFVIGAISDKYQFVAVFYLFVTGGIFILVLVIAAFPSKKKKDEQRGE